MDLTIFVFLVLPLATILLSIVLQKILKSPILVAITFFAIYLIVAFVSFTDTLAEAIIAVLVYTIMAYITAYIVMIICRCRRRVDVDATTNTTSLPRITSGEETQYVTNATMYGNIGRNNMQRRVCKRF